MAQHVWTVLCDKILSDYESPATVSLIQVVERLTLRLPAKRDVNEMIRESQAAGDKGILVNANILLVSWWVRSDYSKAETSHFRYAIINPSGVRMDEQICPLNLLDSVGHRMIVRIADFPLSGLGLHWIWIEEEERVEAEGAPTWSAVARLPLEVVEQPLMPSASSEPPPHS